MGPFLRIQTLVAKQGKLREGCHAVESGMTAFPQQSAGYHRRGKPTEQASAKSQSKTVSGMEGMSTNRAGVGKNWCTLCGSSYQVGNGVDQNKKECNALLLCG